MTRYCTITLDILPRYEAQNPRPNTTGLKDTSPEIVWGYAWSMYLSALTRKAFVLPCLCVVVVVVVESAWPNPGTGALPRQHGLYRREGTYAFSDCFSIGKKRRPRVQCVRRYRFPLGFRKAREETLVARTTAVDILRA